jgi:hypothetical protein
MGGGLKTILIIFLILAVFAGLIGLKMYMSSDQYAKAKNPGMLKNADTLLLENNIKADSLYNVKEVLYQDSAIVIAVTNPEKTGTDTYFNKKYGLNDYANIDMVYIFQYDSTKNLRTVSTDDALMGTGKRLGKFQDHWVAAFIDTADKSCKPLKDFIRQKSKYPESFKNEETQYQPENIHKMHVLCKYRLNDSTGKAQLKEITAVVGADGAIISTQ